MILVENLSYSYGENEVLHDISLEVREQKLTVLFGEDDAGKTTLLELIMGFLPCQSGKISVMDIPGTDFHADRRQKLRYVPDSILLEHCLAKDYLAMIAGLTPDYDKALEEGIVKAFQLNLDEMLDEMTYQDNKYVQIMGAICAKPALLILDEPMNFLSESGYYSLLRVLKSLVQGGTTVFLVTEHYADAMEFADDFLYLREGGLADFGECKERSVRKKVVTVWEGNLADSSILFEQQIKKTPEKEVLLYSRDIKLLPAILSKAGCINWTVEELTLEEEINEDYARWQ